MQIKLTVSFLAVLICLAFPSCKRQSQQPVSKDVVRDDLLKQVSQLDEFKQEKKRVDSFSKTSRIPVTLIVQVVDTSFFAKDSGKNIALAFITEKNPYDEQIIYSVKFDKGRRKIVAVEKDEKAFEKPLLGGADDKILPLNK
jgi:hypothetical protein